MAEEPENVTKFATEKGALDLGGLTLLGTLEDPQGRRALILTATGDVETVAPGDRIGLAQVHAIGDGVVKIGGVTGLRTLTMPAG